MEKRIFGSSRLGNHYKVLNNAGDEWQHFRQLEKAYKFAKG